MDTKLRPLNMYLSIVITKIEPSLGGLTRFTCEDVGRGVGARHEMSVTFLIADRFAIGLKVGDIFDTSFEEREA